MKTMIEHFLKNISARFMKYMTLFRHRGPMNSVLLVLLHSKCSIQVQVISLLINSVLIRIL